MDYLAENYSLHYLHTKDRQEVDFALVCDNQIEKIIEVKNSDHAVNAGLRYFHEKYKLPAVQVVKNLRYGKVDNGIEIVQGLDFLKSLYL